MFKGNTFKRTALIVFTRTKCVPSYECYFKVRALIKRHGIDRRQIKLSRLHTGYFSMTKLQKIPTQMESNKDTFLNKISKFANTFE